MVHALACIRIHSIVYQIHILPKQNRNVHCLQHKKRKEATNFSDPLHIMITKWHSGPRTDSVPQGLLGRARPASQCSPAVPGSPRFSLGLRRGVKSRDLACRSTGSKEGVDVQLLGQCLRHGMHIGLAAQRRMYALQVCFHCLLVCLPADSLPQMIQILNHT